jgi:glucokinase
MTTQGQDQRRLVADVGGTNTRMALFDPAIDGFRALSVYANRDHARLDDIIALWLETLQEEPPGDCCIAAAAPPGGDTVRMVNIDWSFSCAELARRFGFERIGWLNDFQANAYSLPHLKEADLAVLHPGAARAGFELCVMGPGTGLGGATLGWVNDLPFATTCEPGHMGLAPGTAEELALFAHLLPRYGEIHTERLVSGPGLLLIYRTLAELREQIPLAKSPDQVSRQALVEHDPLALSALDTFCALLGSACGDFVLANGAYGGLYLAGGIIPCMLDFLRQSSFHQRFCNKGAMGDHLRQVPVYAITEPQPGLLGAAHAPL